MNRWPFIASIVVLFLFVVTAYLVIFDVYDRTSSFDENIASLNQEVAKTRNDLSQLEMTVTSFELEVRPNPDEQVKDITNDERFVSLRPERHKLLAAWWSLKEFPINMQLFNEIDVRVEDGRLIRTFSPSNAGVTKYRESVGAGQAIPRIDIRVNVLLVPDGEVD